MEGPLGLIAAIIFLALVITQGGEMSDEDKRDYRPPTDRWS